MNIKHLPIFATLYKTGLIFENIFKCAGNKNAEGMMKGFNSLLVLAIVSFLKTGKLSIKVISDILSMFGMNFVNKAKIDHVFQKLLTKVTGEKKIQTNLKKDRFFE